MAGKEIQWFPGHMAVTRRLIRESLPEVDVVFELLDARVPNSSRNPEIRKLLGDKKTVVLLNKADLADPEATAAWCRATSDSATRCVPVNCKTGSGVQEAVTAAGDLLKEKWAAYREKGVRKAMRAMVVGIPNVGKSTFINRLAGARKAKAEDRPGVTKTKQWVRVSPDLELLDMPGILWPKFEEETVGQNLAMIGAIRDEILDSVEIAVLLCRKLALLYPALLAARYKLPPIDPEEDAYDLFLRIGRSRGFLQR